VNEGRFTEDVEKIQDFYANHGYRDTRVTGHELIPHKDDPRKLTLRYTIEEGPRYWFGQTNWQGNTVVHTMTLSNYLVTRPGDLYDKSKITKARQAAFAEYAEQGIYLDIDVKETVGGLTFNVRKGPGTSGSSTSPATQRGKADPARDRHPRGRLVPPRPTLVRSRGDVFRFRAGRRGDDFQPPSTTWTLRSK
jgi:hypothetical protein